MMLGRLQYQTYSSDTTTVQLYLQYHSKLSLTHSSTVVSAITTTSSTPLRRPSKAARRRWKIGQTGPWRDKNFHYWFCRGYWDEASSHSRRANGGGGVSDSGGGGGGTDSGRAEVLPRRVDPLTGQPYSLVFISVCVSVSV